MKKIVKKIFVFVSVLVLSFGLEGQVVDGETKILAAALVVHTAYRFRIIGKNKRLSEAEVNTLVSDLIAAHGQPLRDSAKQDLVATIKATY